MNHNHVGNENSNLHMKITATSNNAATCTIPSEADYFKQRAAEFPEVKFREKRPQTSQERSETQRKRSSKNRLSNRRSTGFVTPEEIETAMALENVNR